MLNILASFAQFERALIAERVRAGMERARRQGKRSWSTKGPGTQPGVSEAAYRGRYPLADDKPPSGSA